MDDARFQTRLAAWQAMSCQLEDAASLAQCYPSPLDTHLDALCVLYLEASTAQQEALARLVAGGPGRAADGPARAARCDVLLGYIQRVARRIKTAGVHSLGWLGLAAAALAAGGADERDVLEACAFLQYTAAEAGLDLAPMLAALAATAQPEAQQLLTALGKSDAATITRIVCYHAGTG